MSQQRGLGRWIAPGALLALALLVAVAAAGGAGALGAERLRGAALVTLLIAAATLYRPHDGCLLGLGSLGIVVGLESMATADAAVAVAAGALVADALRRPLERRRGAPALERRSFRRALERAALAGVGTLLAGAVWTAAGGSEPALWPHGAVAVLVALAPAALFEASVRSVSRGESWSSIVSALQAFFFDLAGLALGLLGVALLRLDSPLGSTAIVAFALLALECARQQLGAEATQRTLVEAEKLSRAGASLVAGGSELARLARRIFSESATIVPFSFAALELDGLEGGSTRFWTADDGAVHEGEPDPPAYPAPLPGFHRREAWRRFEPQLLVTDERRVTLRLWCDPRRLESTAESSLAALLPQMSAAVREALVEREAAIDRLTGAATRRVLDRRLAEAFARCRDEGRALALVVGDLDHFKRINDLHGHPAGDRALAAVAAVLLAPMRGSDLCARFGGEEFVLVFEETTGETALEIAERLRRRIEAIRIETTTGRVELSMSFGVAAFPELSVRVAGELVELADAALYTAKRLGRNLCLLDCGGGRLRTGGGEWVETETGPGASPPVFFA